MTQNNSESYIDRLAEFAKAQYNITALSITAAKRGYYGETWRLDTADNRYFLKLDYSARHQKRYQNSLAVIDYLCDNGIDTIGKIQKTKDGKLYSSFGSAVMGVFEWIDGEHIENEDWKIPEFQMITKIYSLTKAGFDIPSIDFSPEVAHAFYEKWEKLKTEPSSTDNNEILTILEQNTDMLSHRAARLAHFSSLCASDTSHFYITHGDAGGNVIVNNDHMYIIDWDEVMYAPPERDAWVMGCHDWARKAFDDALRQNGIAYTLRTQRLAFYCYHMFFLYLNEFLDDFLLLGRKNDIKEYFHCWIEERIQYADAQ